MRTEDFKEFVKTAKKFYDKRGTIAATSHILFSGKTASMVNFTDRLLVEFETDVFYDTPFTVPFFDFEKIISKVKDSSIFFNLGQEGKVSLVTEKGTFCLLGLEDAKEFPYLFKEDALFESVCRLNKDDLLLIKKAENFTSQDEFRPVMNNVLVDTKTIVSSDSHFMFFHPTQTERSSSFLIPKKIAKHIIGSANEINVLINNDRYIAFKDNNITIFSEHESGKYPNYNAVIPKDNPIEVSVSTKELVDALDTSSIVNTVTGKVLMKVRDSKVSLFSEDIDNNKSFSVELKTGKGNEDMEISFNCQRMITILKSENKDVAVFNMSRPDRAMIINNFYLLMPMAE